MALPAQYQPVEQASRFYEYPSVQSNPMASMFRNFAVPMTQYMRGREERQRYEEKLGLEQAKSGYEERAVAADEGRLEAIRPLYQAQANYYNTQAQNMNLQDLMMRQRGAGQRGGGFSGFVRNAVAATTPGQMAGIQPAPPQQYLDQLAQMTGEDANAVYEKLVTMQRTGVNPATGAILDPAAKRAVDAALNRLGVQRTNYVTPATGQTPTTDEQRAAAIAALNQVKPGA